jgi:creatinine amidohydrolase
MAQRLGDMVWPEVAAAAPMLVIACGSTEQHGPHLPLSTDTVIATWVAERLVETWNAHGRGAVLGPPLSIGASGEHAGFPGTLSAGAEVFERVVVELCRSADAFERVVLVNAHGGNSVALRSALATATAEGRKVTLLRCSVPDGDAHAGRTETSMMLAIAPELVRVDRFEAGDTRPWPEMEPEIRRGGIRAVSANGVLGDPRGATAAEGEAVLASMLASLLAETSDALPNR